LDDKELKRKAHSLDLSILAMCLLNGEILHNGTTEGPRPASQVAVPVYLNQDEQFQIELATFYNLILNE
jgi:hypothetical protein